MTSSRFSVCAVMNGKDLGFRIFSLLPKQLCARQIAFPYSFARINKWRTGYESGLRVERCITFKSNGKREFVPRDRVSSLLVVYGISTHNLLVSRTFLIHKNGL